MKKPTIEELEAQVKQLAAENAALKSSRAILAENALETCDEVYTAGFRNTALHDGLMESTGNRNKYPNPIRTLVDEAKRNMETPATDAILASLRAEAMADGVIALADKVESLPYFVGVKQQFVRNFAPSSAANHQRIRVTLIHSVLCAEVATWLLST